MTPLEWLVFLVAAGLGAPARYLLDGWVQERTAGAFPWGTFVVNVTGCFALGLLAGAGLYHGLGTTPQVVLGSGALGAYTTFSTMTFESVTLVEEGAHATALRNAAGSLVVGLVAASAGIAIVAASG